MTEQHGPCHFGEVHLLTLYRFPRISCVSKVHAHPLVGYNASNCAPTLSPVR